MRLLLHAALDALDALGEADESAQLTEPEAPETKAPETKAA